MARTEYRTAEIRAGEGRDLSGLALPFEAETRIGSIRERFNRGSVTTSGEAVLNVAHVGSRLLAREPATLRFEAKEDGLHMTATLPETREADDALANVRAGILTGLSVEFLATRESYVSGVRVIEAAKVSGVALVPRPAYRGTSVEARAAELAGAASDPEIEAAAHAAGITPAQLRAALQSFGETRLDPEPRKQAGIPDWMIA